MPKGWEIDDTVLSFCRGWKSWHGSFHELGLAYASASLDQQTRLRLIQYTWDDPDLQGVVSHPDDFGMQWKKIESATVSNGKHVYGCIRLDTKRITGCGSYFTGDNSITWFVLYIPLAMLELVYPVDYTHPMTHEGNPWTRKVDEVLAMIGMRIYREFPFKLGGLGEEASAVPIEKLRAELANDPYLLVPESLFEQKGVSPYGLRMADGLWWTGGTAKLT